MKEASSRAKEPKMPDASSPRHETRARSQKKAAVADEETIPSNAVKTDLEILAFAMQDIDLINSALSTNEPISKLKNGRNVMAAYREFMRKGREERDFKRSWEDNPDDKLFNEGIQWFSRIVQRYGPWSKENPCLAKDFRLSQYIDAHPSRFGARMPTKEELRKVPRQAA